MQLLHAFEEERASSRRAHIKAFFGVIPGDDDQYNPEDGSYIVCWCGGRLVPISRDSDDSIEVAAVWHNPVDLSRLSNDD